MDSDSESHSKLHSKEIEENNLTSEKNITNMQPHLIKSPKNKIILPKLSCKNLDPFIIPERPDIYKKIKIRDIMGIGSIVKPPFKLK